jgi:L-lysine cyclodeaminase
MDKSLNQTLVLSCQDVQHIVRYYGLDYLMDTLIERLQKTMEAFDPAATVIPVRSGFNYTTPQPGLIEWMPLFNRGRQVMIKVVGYHPRNPVSNGLPTIISTLSTYDTSSGRLLGIVDGVLLTALRTGAASAVASRVLANPESRILGLIGCGAQAVTQFHALSRVFPLEKILFFDIDAEAVQSFPGRCASFANRMEMNACGIQQIVQESDVLCTATSIDIGAGPLFTNLETKPFLHINAVGSDFPGKTELPPDLLRKSFVCPDFREQAVLEGECQQLLPEDIGPDIIDILQNPGKYKHIRQQRSVFDSTGWALEDQVAMEMFLEYGTALGLGTFLDIESIPEVANNPYHFVLEQVLKTP